MSIPAQLEDFGSPTAPRGARRTLRLLAAGATAGGEARAVTIHNISATGLLLEGPEALAVGEVLALELPAAGERRAEVVWTSGRLAGCRFDAPLSPAALSAAQLQSAVDAEVALDGPGALGVFGGGGGEAFGTKLQRLRRAAGLTLADIAARLGVSKPTVWAWEQGKARPIDSRLDALGAVLGVGGDELAAPAGSDGKLGEATARARRDIAAAAGASPARIRIFVEI